jgi:hypothetical protein
MLTMKTPAVRMLFSSVMSGLLQSGANVRRWPATHPKIRNPGTSAGVS